MTFFLLSLEITCYGFADRISSTEAIPSSGITLPDSSCKLRSHRPHCLLLCSAHLLRWVNVTTTSDSRLRPISPHAAAACEREDWIWLVPAICRLSYFFSGEKLQTFLCSSVTFGRIIAAFICLDSKLLDKIKSLFELWWAPRPKK